MKKSRVVVVDILNESLESLHESLLISGVSEIEQLSTSEFLSGHKIGSVNLILLKCHILNEPLMKGLTQFTQRNISSPILVLAQQISIYAYRQVTVMKNIVILQTPVISTIFEGLIQELLQEDRSSLLPKPRFITNEPARMIVMDSGLLIPSRMRNFSAGGAFLEYKGISLKVGHNINLNLLNHKVKSTKDRLQMSARVIWIRDGDNPLSTARGIGVQFYEAT